MHRISIALLLCLGIGCAARTAASSASSGSPNGLEQSVRAHMQFLAGDALNGRASGTRDEWIAASYIAAHFMRLGLTPVGQGEHLVHEVRIERAAVNSPPTLRSGGREFTHIKDMLVLAFASPTVTAPLQKYQAGMAVKSGAALLLPATNPPSTAEIAAAAVVLSLETEPQQKRRLAGSGPPFPPLRMQWIVGTPRRATVALEKSAYEALANLADGTPVTVSADVAPATTSSTWNTIAQLRGRDATRRSEIIVLSAHHDHVGNRPPPKPDTKTTDTIYNGADDDASGTIAVMELAAALVRSGSDRTVIFATFGSEETGGQGSTHFIEASGVELAAIAANLQFEMIGRPDPKVPPQTLWLTGYERSTLGEALARRGARLVADPHPEQNFFVRSDNIRFARRGVVAHTVSSYGLHTDYHEPTDEIGQIDFAHMTRAIESLIAPIRWLADSDFRPQWKAGMRP